LPSKADRGATWFCDWLFEGAAKIPRLTAQMRAVKRAEYREKRFSGLRTLPSSRDFHIGLNIRFSKYSNGCNKTNSILI